MKRVLWAAMLLAGLATGIGPGLAGPLADAASAQAGQSAKMGWSKANLAILRRWVVAAPEDGLPVPSTVALDAALARGDAAEIDDAATMLALRLAQLHLLGDARSRARAGWNILDTDRDVTLEPLLAQAQASGTLDLFSRPLGPLIAIMLRSERRWRQRPRATAARLSPATWNAGAGCRASSIPITCS